MAGLSETTQYHPTAQSRRRTGDARFPFLRVRQLERIIFYRHGDRLPDDDDGRDLLRVVAHHLAQIGPGRIRPWALQWLPTIAAAELDDLITQAGAGWRWRADELAHEIGLDDATRKRLRTTTIGAIDCDKLQRLRRRKRKGRAAARARRARAGAKPHARSAAETQPWIKEGISRATWYRQRAAEKADRETRETNSSAAILPSDMRDQIQQKPKAHQRPKGAAEARSTDLPSRHRDMSRTSILGGGTARKGLGNGERAVPPAPSWPQREHVAAVDRAHAAESVPIAANPPALHSLRGQTAATAAATSTAFRPAGLIALE